MEPSLSPWAGFERETRERLERLERQLRLWRRGALAAAGVAALTVAGAMAEPPARELAVHTLRVVDNEGRNRLVLTADPAQPDMTFFDPSGKSRLTLDIAKDRKPVLMFADEAGDATGRLVLGLEDGLPGLSLYDTAGRKRVAFGIPREGGPVLRVLDENEKLRMRFP
jgi:hypothetical protein